MIGRKEFDASYFIELLPSFFYFVYNSPGIPVSGVGLPIYAPVAQLLPYRAQLSRLVAAQPHALVKQYLISNIENRVDISIAQKFVQFIQIELISAF